MLIAFCGRYIMRRAGELFSMIRLNLFHAVFVK